MRTFCFTIVMLMLLAVPVQATVVDATQAEELFQAGEYRLALAKFAQVAEDFRQTSTDSDDYHIYREAEYLYDRLADCSFTQRDWTNLKRYMDGVYALSLSEQNLTKEQLAGALASGVAFATANYLSARLDETVRYSTLVQVKRSIVLVLFVTQGEGVAGQAAINLYQQLVVALGPVTIVDDGFMELNVPMLEHNIADFEEIIAGLEGLAIYPEVGDLALEVFKKNVHKTYKIDIIETIHVVDVLLASVQTRHRICSHVLSPQQSFVLWQRRVQAVHVI